MGRAGRLLGLALLAGAGYLAYRALTSEAAPSQPGAPSAWCQVVLRGFPDVYTEDGVPVPVWSWAVSSSTTEASEVGISVSSNCPAQGLDRIVVVLPDGSRREAGLPVPDRYCTLELRLVVPPGSTVRYEYTRTLPGGAVEAARELFTCGA